MPKHGLPKQDDWPDRRAFVALVPGAAFWLAGCATRPAQPVSYGPTQKLVTYTSRERPGTIVVDPANHFLYAVQKGDQAVQYEVGVGKEGYGWSGVATVHNKQEWPDWYPTRDILDRKPEIRQYMVQLQSGYGMHGVPIIRSVRAHSISGRVRSTRFIEFTAPTNPRRLVTTSPPAASACATRTSSTFTSARPSAPR
jgi:lipoprotein-anchoring transpeptidase ErfK/SrfK